MKDILNKIFGAAGGGVAEKLSGIVDKFVQTKEEKAAFLSSMNSYLGIMKHYKSYKLRKQMIFKRLSSYWFNHVYLSGGIAKFVLKVRPVKKNQRNANITYTQGRYWCARFE